MLNYALGYHGYITVLTKPDQWRLVRRHRLPSIDRVKVRVSVSVMAMSSDKNEIWWQEPSLTVVWNRLPAAVHKADSLYLFKHRLKTHLFTLYFNDWLTVFMYTTNFCNAFQVRFRVGKADLPLNLLTYLLTYLLICSHRHRYSAKYETHKRQACEMKFDQVYVHDELNHPLFLSI